MEEGECRRDVVLLEGAVQLALPRLKIAGAKGLEECAQAFKSALFAELGEAQGSDEANPDAALRIHVFGGAAGKLAPDLLAVNGSLKTHRDGESITAFLLRFGVRPLELHDGRITDVGGILPLTEEGA